MKSKKSLSFSIAFCGIICALATLSMFGSLIPSMTYVLPAFSGILLWIICEQINRKWALLSYCCVVALSFIVIPEFEANIYFTFFFGYYPIIRGLILSRFPKRLLSVPIRFAVFNAAVVVAYFIVSRVIGVDAVLEGLEQFGQYALLILWIAGNIAFFFYDICLNNLEYAYIRWLKPRIAKMLK